MPQISPMNWMMMLCFFFYIMLFIKKKIMFENLKLTKKYFFK